MKAASLEGISDQFFVGSKLPPLPFSVDLPPSFPESPPAVFSNLSMFPELGIICRFCVLSPPSTQGYAAPFTAQLTERSLTSCAHPFLSQIPCGIHCCFQVLCYSLRFSCLYPRPSGTTLGPYLCSPVNFSPVCPSVELFILVFLSN